MKPFLNYKTNSGQFMLVMVLINAVILKQAYIENADLYWLLAATLPISIFAAIRIAIPGRTVDNGGSTSAPVNRLKKQKTKTIKTRDYDYAEF
jgi:hypothetical protein